LVTALACCAFVGCGKPAEKTPQQAAKPAASATPPVAATTSSTIGGLFVDDGGSAGSGGVPVVFVHSFAGSSQHWKAQLAELRSSRRAVAFDFPGHGRSAAPVGGDVSVASLAGAIGTVVDGLEVPRFVLVGHSMGGSAAIAYAAENPDRVAGLILVGAPGRTPPADAQRVMKSLEANYDKVMADYWTKLLAGARPKTRAQIERERRALSKDLSLALIGETFAFDPQPGLAKYGGPKLLLDTAHGESPTSLAKLNPKIKRQVIPETSHWPQLDKPMRFNRILKRALKGMS
jgi:pimeloyl-ACP methyl ester carboxylesterase